MPHVTPAMSDHSVNGGYGHKPQPTPHPGPTDGRGQYIEATR